MAIKCNNFISLAPSASSTDVFTFIVILAQLWLLGNHTELVNKPSKTIGKKGSKLCAVHVLVLSFSECYRAKLFKEL